MKVPTNSLHKSAHDEMELSGSCIRYDLMFGLRAKGK